MSRGDDGVPRWAALAIGLPFMAAAVGLIGLVLALLAASGMWVWFWIGIGAETYALLVVVGLLRSRRRRAGR